MADGEPTERPVPVQTVARGQPFVIRYPQVALAGLRLARSADVMYATATYAAAAAAATGGPPAAGRQARLRPRLRARLAVRPVPRHPRGVPEGTGPALGGAQAAAHDVTAAGAPDRRAEPLPRRDRRRLGTRPRRIEVLVNPAPAPADVEPAPLEPGHVRLRRTADASEGAARRCWRRSPRSTAPGSSSSATGADRAALERRVHDARARGPSPLRRRAPARPGARAARGRARRRSLQRLGEPAARRSRGAFRRHARRRRPRSAVFRRWCGTARTACSSRPTIPRPWPAPCEQSCTTTRSGIVWLRPRSRRWPRSAVT